MRREEQLPLFTIDRTLLRVAREAFSQYHQGVIAARDYGFERYLVVFEDGTWSVYAPNIMPRPERSVRVSLPAAQRYETSVALAEALERRAYEMRG